MANESNQNREGMKPATFTASWARRSAIFAALVALVGCAKAGDGEAAHGGMTRAELVAKLERAMTRENPEQPVHEVQLLEGRVTGKIESLKRPTPECKRDRDGDLTCTFVSELGKDEDGDDCSVVCQASTYTSSFGTHVKAMIGDSATESPVLETKAFDQGMSSLFAANYIGETSTKVVFGTAKVAVLYAGGYGVTCFDAAPGGQKTFRRVVGRLFESLAFDPDPKYAPVAAAAYQLRTGDKPLGFRYNLVRARSDGEGYVETNTEFRLKTDGETWKFFDRRVWVVRDAGGDVEDFKSFHWVNGHGPAVLSAKPGEDNRFRLKFQNGPVSNGLDSTPKAPLNTEFWIAPELGRVSKGALNRYVYADMSVEDSDPAFYYVALTRSAPGVLMESESAKFPGESDEGKPKVQDQLHVNEHGVVTKEVTAESVSELLHAWGQLPSVKKPKGGKK